MRFDRHSTTHWFAVALVAALALFTFNHAYGQSAGAAAAFEGRPALAGAQGGLGAQSGVAQGGIGVQGSDASQRQLDLRKPGGLDTMPAAPGAGSEMQNVAGRSEVKPVPRKDGVNRDARPASKAKRAVKRTVKRSRTGVGEIDSSTSVVR